MTIHNIADERERRNRETRYSHFKDVRELFAMMIDENQSPFKLNEKQKGKTMSNNNYELIQAVSISNSGNFRGRITVYERNPNGTFKPVWHNASVIIRDNSREAMQDAEKLAQLWMQENKDKRVEIKKGHAA